MNSQVIVPIILVLFTGFIFYVLYLMWQRKIKITIGSWLLIILAITCFASCQYYMNFVEQKEVAIQAQDEEKLKVLNESKMKHFQQYTSSDIESMTLSATGNFISVLQGKMFTVSNLYYLADMERQNGTVYVFASVPGGKLGKEDCVLFFCGTSNSAVKEICRSLSPVKPATISLAFMIQEDGPAKDGKRVVILRGIIKDVMQ